MRRAERQEGWGGKLLTWALVVALLGGAVYLGVLEAQQGTLIAPGETAPAFSWPRHQGGQVSLAESRGQVVLVDFWATWCPPCVREMPILVKLAQEYGPQGLTFVAANAEDSAEQEDAVKSFIANRLPALAPYVAYPDPQSLQGYRVASYPTLYLIDRSGKVAVARAGEIPESMLRRWIEEALSEDEPSSY